MGVLAGVSQSTVSHVVNRTGRIPEETEQRVWDAIGELGYRPNETARNLRLRRSHTLGLVTDRIASSPFAGRILRGAEEFAWERGYLLLLVDAKEDPSIESAAVDTLLARQVDALLYAAMSWRGVDASPGFTKVPALLVNAWPAGSHKIPAIVPAETEGGRLAASAVIRAGHNRIAFLGGPVDEPARVDREAGFRKAMAEARLAVNERWVLSGNYHISSGHALAHQVLSTSERPTAVVCGNDRMAVGVISASLELGLRVPEDLSVVGYDDQEDLADQITPALTTVRIPHYEMGRTAVEHLLEALDTGRPPKGATIPPSLVLRNSVAPYVS